MNLLDLFESKQLNEEFGSRYAEQLAQRLYDEHPDLDTSADENEVLDHAFELAQQELGQRRAHSLFAYDEDFAGDLLAAYSVLSQGQGVEEARYFKTSYGYAGGLNPKTGKKYKHPEQIRIDREARKKQQSQEKSQDPTHWNFGSSVMAEDQKVDPILYKALARMKGDTWLDAETALATQFGIMKKSSDPGLFKDYTQKLLDLYKQKQGISEAIPAHIKPSDLPPAMRSRRLTMKDIEAERPQGAYRYRVGEKEFMDLAAAKEFAAATGQPVQQIREAQKKNSSPRIEKILKQLHIQYPQAKDDLEALVFSMQSGQRQDRTDINRLDAENDTEEAEIADIERMIQVIKDRRAELSEKKDRTPGKISKSEDPCWSGYHMVGTKKKGGRTVPNCVPGEKGSTNEDSKTSYAVSVQRSGPNEMPV